MRKILFLLLLAFIKQPILTIHHHSLHRYFIASYNHFSGNMDSAGLWYERALNSPYCSYSYKGYITFLFDTKKYQTILTLMPNVQDLFENDPEMHLIFATALDITGDTQKSDEFIIAAYPKFKNHYGITIKTTQAYMRRQDTKNALLVLTNFLNNNPQKTSYFILYYLKAQLNIQLNQLPQALSDITMCINIHPSFDRGWLLQAQLLEQKGKIEDAIRGYYTFIELSGGNELVKQHLTQLMIQYTKNYAEKKFQKTVYEQALSLYNRGDYKTALTLLEQNATQDLDNHVLMIKVAAQLHEYEKLTLRASEWIKKNTAHAKDSAQALYLLSFSDIPNADVITVLEKVYTQCPDNYWLLLYAGDIHIRNQEIEKAIALLEKAETLVSCPSLSANICYQLSVLYHEIHNAHSAHAFLKKGYQYNTDHAYSNNALAYHYATAKKIEKAEKHCAAALKKQPHNNCFRDTQALIYYKKKEYAKAQEILEVLPEKHTVESLLVLAKIHYKLHNKDKALDYTKQLWPLVTRESDKQRLRKLELQLAYNDQ